MAINAIETRYKGYRFRSRLEARWAVFLDALGLKWEYEKEGFEFARGKRYLPDFFIINWQLWIEVKGDYDPNAPELCELLRDHTNNPVLLFSGLPSEETHYGKLFCCDMSDSSCGSSSWVVSFQSDGNIPYLSTADEHSENKTLCDGNWDSLGFVENMTTGDNELVNRATNRARAARFEHGENG